LTAASSPEDVGLYAERTFVRTEWVEEYIRKGRPLARSFIGIPVEVAGNRWGVLVLDSKREMRSAPTTLKLYTLVARFLATLLERA